MSNDTSFELRFLNKSKEYLERVRQFAEEKKARWDEFQATGQDVKSLMRRVGAKEKNEVVSWGFEFEEIFETDKAYCLPATAWANQNATNMYISGEKGELEDILSRFPDLDIEGEYRDEYGWGFISGSEQIQEGEIDSGSVEGEDEVEDDEVEEGEIEYDLWDGDEDEEEDEEEIVDYESSLKLNPDFSNRAWAIRASTHASRGDMRCDAALGFYNQAVESGMQEKYGKAISLYKEAIKADPDYPWSHNNLAWLHATCMNPSFHNGVEAVRHAQKACELVGYNFWSMLDTLAASYARAGDFEQAVKWGEKSLELAPDDAKSEERKRLDFYKKNLPYTCIICINSDGTLYNYKNKK